MPTQRKSQVLRPGFNKFGFKIKKPVERASATSKGPALQAKKATRTLKSVEATQSGTGCTVPSSATFNSQNNSPPALDVPVRKKNVKTSASARKGSPAASKSRTGPRIAPPLNTAPSVVPSTASQPTIILDESRTNVLSNSSFTNSRTEAAKSVDVTVGQPIRKRRPDVDASNPAAEDDVDVTRLDVRTSLQGERLCSEALSQDGEHEHTINTRGPPHVESLPVRCRTPRAASEASLSTPYQRTPSYVRQLQDAAHFTHFTDGINHSHPPSQEQASIPRSPRLRLEVAQVHTATQSDVKGLSSLEMPTKTPPRPIETVEHPENSSTPAYAAQKTLSDSAALAFTLTSTPPKLVSSSGQYDEYVFTTTGVTPRRIEQWKKIAANMAEHEKRRRLFPRRPVFHQPIKERIALPRLEVFWRNMSDLIADCKLFCHSMWDKREYIGPCVRKINEGLPPQDQFDMEESCAAARELQRQRFVMFTGGGQLMLTRNAV
ncbi:hypothetical protein EJ07DRAFT_184089 [Lizonia empirigonia]|nr:hypothetical protein EJ07DRAFT_184089 [Lizonia empirigonia]